MRPIDGDGYITGLSAGGLPAAGVKAEDLNGAQTGAALGFGVRAWCVFNVTISATGKRLVVL